MSSPSRAAQFTKLHRILRKYYHPVESDPNRPVLEHLLYACLLENAQYAAADEAYAALVHGFFDWNEIRVSTVRELAEVMPGLPDPLAAANRAKRALQNVFEATYAFDLEELRKLNLGPASDRLRKIDGVSEFGVSYVIQNALAGHAIPIDAGTMRALYAVDLVTGENAKEGVVPGLERAIPKSKGGEFGSLLHQLGADYVADPYSSNLHEILVQVDPVAGERLPKRRVKKAAEEPGREPRPAAPRESAKPAEPAAAQPVPAAEPPKKAPEKEKAAEKPAERKKKPAEPAPVEAKQAAEPVEAAPPKAEKPALPKEEKPAKEEAEAAAKKKPAANKKKPAEKAKAVPPPKPKTETEAPKKKPDSGELAKRKPR